MAAYVYGDGMFAFVAFTALIGIAIPPGRTDAAAVLRALRSATGGQAWSHVRGLSAVGRKASFGLTGRYRETDDLRSGRFVRGADYGILANAEGADAHGRWRLDGSGRVHPLDSPEARAIATTEQYLARRGYLQDDPTTRRRLLPGLPNSAADIGVEVTPPGGRAAVLWIRRSDARLERVTIALSPHLEEIRYSDYRRVGALLLPFRIAVDHGDEAESGTARIASYRLLTRLPAAAFARPPSREDVTFRSRAATTTVPARVDRNSGFLLVDASVNGAPPAPYIIDTAGHDILTPREAARLHLRVTGSGKSYGVGAGSTATRFTRVRSVGLGSARLGPQPFTVLALDLGTTRDASGHAAPVAGLLGLEIFERFAVTIRGNTVTFARNPAEAACRATALQFTNDMPLARATVDGVEGLFGIDTGNNVRPILFAHFLRAHGIAAEVAPGGAMESTSVGGSMALAHGRIARLGLGPATFRDVPVDVSSMGTGALSTRSEAGNLGLSLLARFDRVTFDYAHGRMCLVPRA